MAQEEREASRKSYLGDAVYVDADPVGLILTTEDGIRTTNTIVLEPEVFAAMVLYAERVLGWKVRL